jgi:hypothetical protein
VTDIPQVYLDEANRLWNDPRNDNLSPKELLARTLQELGWEPPVDPKLVRARKIAAKYLAANGRHYYEQLIENGGHDEHDAVQAALIALTEGMGE